MHNFKVGDRVIAINTTRSLLKNINSNHKGYFTKGRVYLVSSVNYLTEGRLDIVANDSGLPDAWNTYNFIPYSELAILLFS